MPFLTARYAKIFSKRYESQNSCVCLNSTFNMLLIKTGKTHNIPPEENYWYEENISECDNQFIHLHHYLSLQKCPECEKRTNKNKQLILTKVQNLRHLTFPSSICIQF